MALFGFNSAAAREAIARAEEEIKTLKSGYIEWVKADLDQMVGLIDSVRASHGANPAAIRAIHSSLHNIKGQGATFGFNLVTDIAQVGCRLLQERESVNPEELKVADVCRSLIRVAIEHGMEGDGGEKGRQMLARLVAMAEAA